MNDSKNVHGLESDLQDEKRDLRQDLADIAVKARENASGAESDELGARKNLSVVGMGAGSRVCARLPQVPD